jgi:uncharacterized lipoprotein YajG
MAGWVRRSLCIMFFALLAGCAPGLGESLRVSNPSIVESGLHSNNESHGVRVALRAVHDSRKRNEIGEISGRKLSADGDVRVAVKERMLEHLKMAGISSGDSSPSFLELEVLEWFVKVGPGFPTTEVVAKAGVVASLLTSSNELLYRGRYGGDAREVNIFFSEGEVEQILLRCMDRALNELVNDPQMLSQIDKSV